MNEETTPAEVSTTENTPAAETATETGKAERFCLRLLALKTSAQNDRINDLIDALVEEVRS